MNTLAETIKELQEEAELCWAAPGHPMRAWAEEVEQQGGHHGMGDLSQMCPRRPPGTSCPACGRRF
jgi:hypothetical protein